MATKFRIVTICSLFLACTPIVWMDAAKAQSIYKCTDSNGKTSYDAHPCAESSKTKILNEVKPRADAAPLELVAAYKKCLVAIYQSNTPAFYDCFTRQEAQARRDRNSAVPKLHELYDGTTVTPLSGNIDKKSGTGNIFVRTVSANTNEYLFIDFQWETGQWKVAAISATPMEKIIDRPSNTKDFKVCAPHVKSC
jgi:Domain of unknown function (DUF4124)